MKTYSKRIKRLLREYASKAHEKELHRELTKVEDSFAEWRQGRISSGELDHRIHKYKTGPARELYKRYNYSDTELAVAYAIVAGVLAEDEIPAELAEAISGPIAFYRSWQDEDRLRAADDFGS
jgi:hypothetical protein